jgi:hypothetical protein
MEYTDAIYVIRDCISGKSPSKTSQSNVGSGGTPITKSKSTSATLRIVDSTKPKKVQILFWNNSGKFHRNSYIKNNG